MCAFHGALLSYGVIHAESALTTTSRVVMPRVILAATLKEIFAVFTYRLRGAGWALASTKGQVLVSSPRGESHEKAIRWEWTWRSWDTKGEMCGKTQVQVLPVVILI